MAHSHPQEDGTRERVEKNGKLSAALGGWARENGCYFHYFRSSQNFRKWSGQTKTNKQTWTASQNDALIQVPQPEGTQIFIIGTMSDGSSVMHLLLGREV